MVKQQVNPLRDSRLRDAILTLPLLTKVRTKSQLSTLIIKNVSYYSRPDAKFPIVEGFTSVSPRKSWKNILFALLYLQYSDEDRAELHEWYSSYTDIIHDASLNQLPEMLEGDAGRIPCGLTFEMVRRFVCGYFGTERFAVNVAVLSKILVDIENFKSL